MADDDEDDDDIGLERVRRNRKRQLKAERTVGPEDGPAGRNAPDRREATQLPAFGNSDGLPEQVQVLLALRASRLKRFLIRFGVFIVLPTLLVLFYTLVIVTPRYECTFQEVYQVYQPTSSLAGAPVQTVTSSSDAVDYASVLAQYIQSAALAEQLDQQIHLRAHWSDPTIDWTSRLAKDASLARYLAYFNAHVQVSEGFGGYLTVSAQGFDAAYTLLLSKTINQDADAMLNGMTLQARQAEVAAAKAQLANASTALTMANTALTTFRNTHGDLDPTMIATELGTIEGTLETQLANLRAQLAQAQANLQPSATQIVQLNLQISGVEKQLEAERQRLANSNGQNSYSDTVAQYDLLLSNQQLASSTFQAAQQGLVIAQADASAKQDYVVDFVAPVLPDRPTVPDPMKSAGLAFLSCILVYSICNLLLSAMRDQTGV
jgi:capsular polysaccharide transport system permease protein